jgi:hypothetical protein
MHVLGRSFHGFGAVILAWTSKIFVSSCFVRGFHSMFHSSVDKRGVWRLLMTAAYSGTRNPVELEFAFFPSLKLYTFNRKIPIGL